MTTPINSDRPTGEIVAEAEARIRAAGREPKSSERWEGDGIWQVWIAGTEGEACLGLTIGGNDTGMDPGISLDGDGEGGDCPEDTSMWPQARTWEEAIRHLTVEAATKPQ